MLFPGDTFWSRHIYESTFSFEFQTLGSSNMPCTYPDSTWWGWVPFDSTFLAFVHWGLPDAGIWRPSLWFASQGLESPLTVCCTWCSLHAFGSNTCSFKWEGWVLLRTTEFQKHPLVHKPLNQGGFFARFLGGNLRQIASKTLSFFKSLSFFGKCLDFFFANS